MKNPFFVLATQNPIEQEGTYPLPEAQLDRFLFLIKVDYPTADEEEQIMRQGTSDTKVTIEPVLNAEDIISLQQIVRRVPVSDKVFGFAKLHHAVESPRHAGSGGVRAEVADLGCRASRSMNLILAAKASLAVTRQQPRRRR